MKIILSSYVESGENGLEEYRKSHFTVRTDLAVEERESFPGDGGEISGVEVREWNEKNETVHLTEVLIRNEHGVQAMGKPKGSYITIEAEQLAKKDEDFHREVSEVLSGQIGYLLEQHHLYGKKAKKNPSVLVVGLGNRDATPDSLGPRVLEHLQVTRHLNLEYGEKFCEKNNYPILSGIVPGVMAQTGMETAEILKGVVEKICPDVLLIIDALAARSVKRLGTTIQLSDAGIHPGSGVGNHRNSLTEEILGIPVLAIGVPTVVGAASIVHDTIGAMEAVWEHSSKTKGCGTILRNMDQEEQYELIREIMEPQFGPMYVTPHDIDERVQNLSFTISEAIHGALF